MNYEYLDDPDPCEYNIGDVVCLVSDTHQRLRFTIGRLYAPTTQIPEWRVKLYGVDSNGKMVDTQLAPRCLRMFADSSEHNQAEEAQR